MTGTYTPGQGFTNGDPRLTMARALMLHGSNATPVQSPVEGMLRALQGGVGGWVANNAKTSGQAGTKAAMAIMSDPSLPEADRYAKAAAAYSEHDPVGTNPIEGMQMKAMLDALKPKDPIKLSKNDRLVDPKTNKVTLEAAPDLPQGFRINPDSGAVEVMPGFEPAITGLKKAESAATAQGTADVKLAMEPRQIAAETPAKAAQQAVVTSATRQATNAVPLATDSPAYKAAVELAQVTARRQGENATPLNTDSPEHKAAVEAAQARARRETELAVPLPPTGYQPAPGGVAPIPGGPQDPATVTTLKQAETDGGPSPKLTEDQSKAAGYALRLKTSHNLINGIDTAVTNTLAQQNLKAIPLVGNFFTKEQTQLYDQAQRDFINAQLRRESGATIQDAEFENAKKQYFPQPGDTDKTIAQKKANRELALTGMEYAARGQLPPEYAPAPRGTPKPPPVPPPAPSQAPPPASAEATPRTVPGGGRKVVVQNGMRFDADTQEYLGQATP